MFNYLSKFIPNNHAHITAPLKDLLKDDVFIWNAHHEQALFSQLKLAVTKASILTFFDSNKDLLLKVDVSLGATILQEGHP